MNYDSIKKHKHNKQPRYAHIVRACDLGDRIVFKFVKKANMVCKTIIKNGKQIQEWLDKEV